MKNSRNVLILILSVLLVAAITGNVILYMRYQHAQDQNPNVQTQRIVDELRKSTSLPDETPSVLTVVDKSKLTDSQIAKDAQNGDKILLFQKSGQVIIYRPSTHKLINILSLSSASQNSATQNGTTTDSDAKPVPAPAPSPTPNR